MRGAVARHRPGCRSERGSSRVLSRTSEPLPATSHYNPSPSLPVGPLRDLYGGITRALYRAARAENPPDNSRTRSKRWVVTYEQRFDKHHSLPGAIARAIDNSGRSRAATERQKVNNYSNFDISLVMPS